MFLIQNIQYLLKKINKQEFSRKTNIPRRTLEDIYYGKVPNPRIDNVVKIAKELNISLDDLVYKDLSKE